MRDREAFLKPIAHRGLHDASQGVIENTAPAFEAALGRPFGQALGIECDLQPALGGLPVVFHDHTLDRLTAGTGPVAAFDGQALQRFAFKGDAVHGTRIITFGELLDLVAGRCPLLVELKSTWRPPDPVFIKTVTSLATAYRGPVALMSFDPAVMAAVRALAPRLNRGIVAGAYQGPGWDDPALSPKRRAALADLLESGPAAPDFYAYDVSALPTPVTRFVREVEGRPVFTWTVRTAMDLETARAWADAPIFEGLGSASMGRWVSALAATGRRLGQAERDPTPAGKR